jgi:hypothetical protein
MLVSFIVGPIGERIRGRMARGGPTFLHPVVGPPLKRPYSLFKGCPTTGFYPFGHPPPYAHENNEMTLSSSLKLGSVTEAEESTISCRSTPFLVLQSLGAFGAGKGRESDEGKRRPWKQTTTKAYGKGCHGLPKVSPGPAMPYSSTPSTGGPPLKRPYGRAAVFYPFGHPTPYVHE